MIKSYITLFLIICSLPGLAQELWADAREPVHPGKDESYWALAIVANPPPSIDFSNVSHYTSGVTVNQTSAVVLSGTIGVLWGLSVRASGDLQNGSNTIPIGTINMGVQGVSGTGVSVILSQNSSLVLSTANQTLMTGLLSLVELGIRINLRYTASGGSAYLKPAGTYTTTLTYSASGL